MGCHRGLDPCPRVARRWFFPQRARLVQTCLSAFVTLVCMAAAVLGWGAVPAIHSDCFMFKTKHVSPPDLAEGSF